MFSQCRPQERRDPREGFPGLTHSLIKPTFSNYLFGASHCVGYWGLNHECSSAPILEMLGTQDVCGYPERERALDTEEQMTLLFWNKMDPHVRTYAWVNAGKGRDSPEGAAGRD